MMRAVECNFALRERSAMRTARCYHGHERGTISIMRSCALAACVLVAACAPPRADAIE